MVDLNRVEAPPLWNTSADVHEQPGAQPLCYNSRYGGPATASMVKSPLISVRSGLSGVVVALLLAAVLAVDAGLDVHGAAVGENNDGEVAGDGAFAGLRPATIRARALSLDRERGMMCVDRMHGFHRYA